MDFFEDQDNKENEQSEIDSDISTNDVSESSEKTEENDISLDDDFWKGLKLPDIKVKKEKPKKHILVKLLCSVLLMSAGFGIAVVGVRGQGWLSNVIAGKSLTNFTLPIADKPSSDESDKDKDGKYTTEGLAKNLSSSVVSLEIYSSKTNIVPSSQGSGIIISDNGYIVTNSHVVHKAAAIKAVLNDGSEYQAKLIGEDVSSDLAVIKVASQNLQPAEFGNSSEVKLGEEIMTIGSPGGYYGTVTKGIVSGLGRSIRMENSAVKDCIQIDAAINPGNSGGALFNMWGQVVGVTSSKLASSEYEGIGFAISSNYAKPVIEKLMSNGSITNQSVKIGVTFYKITDTTAKMQNTRAGISIVSIDKSCDVSKTKLRAGDIITTIDGKDVTKIDDIPSLIQSKKPGDKIKCHFYRKNENGKETEFDIQFKLMLDDGGLVENKDSNTNNK